MKRSDMIHSIASELLLSWLDVKGLEGLPDFKEAQQIAELLLVRIEKEGMMPPVHYLQIPADQGGGHKVDYPMLEWEFEESDDELMHKIEMEHRQCECDCEWCKK